MILNALFRKMIQSCPVQQVAHDMVICENRYPNFHPGVECEEQLKIYRLALLTFSLGSQRSYLLSSEAIFPSMAVYHHTNAGQ